MKLKLPLLLLQAVLLLQSSLAAVVVIDPEKTSNPDKDRQKYTMETTVDASGDSLIYNDWACPDVDSSSRITKTGAIFHNSSSSSNLNFQGEYSLTISKGTMTSLGGFIYSEGGINFLNMRDITFEDNVIDVTYRVAVPNGILNAAKDISFKDVGNIVVTGNSGSVRLFYAVNGGIKFENTGDITISNNSTATKLALLFSGRKENNGIIFSNTGKLVFSDNTGGVLNSGWEISFNKVKGLSFEGNHCSTNGGAIYISQAASTANSIGLRIENAGEVAFLNNRSDHRGGAIASEGIGAPSSNVLLSADNGNILFKGNTSYNDPVWNKGITANAICFLKSNTKGAIDDFGKLTLRAKDGYEITFYDPIVTLIENNLDRTTLATITLNKSDNAIDYNGIIRFDGSQVTEYIIKGEREEVTAYQKRLDDSRYSDIQGNTSLEGGSLILTNEVVYGRKIGTVGAETKFSFNKGFLEISNKSHLNATNFTVAGLPSVFRMDKSSLINAKTFTAASGLSFDVDYWLNNAEANVMIKAENASFGGVIGMHDNHIMDAYSDNQWANTLRFNLIDTSQVGKLEKEFSGIQSKLTGSSTVDSAYQHQGEWTYEWVGTQLVGIWTPLGGITDVNPELEGNIVSNSMWSSASNAKSLSSAALANVNILRLKSELQNNFWVKGIGDFAYDDSSAELDGYSYQGGGYAAGADFKIAKQSLVGLAFGQLIGHNKSELYNAKIKQESMMGSIYGAHLQTLNKRNSLLWTLAGTYGDTENSMSTYYSDGQSSAGSWNNNTYFVEAQLEWRIAPEGKNWTYKPFIGVEYTDVTMESFTETGDKVRHFGEGSYKSLSLPIGMGIEHQSRFGHKTWLNALSLAYVPDVYREAPNTQATRLSNGFSWKDQGSKANIHTLRATINSTLQFNAAWTAYAGYTFEARGGASYHNVNTGVSYSF